MEMNQIEKISGKRECGRLVVDLSGRKSAGYYQIPWDAKVNGIYSYTFESKEYKENGKLVIIK